MVLKMLIFLWKGMLCFQDIMLMSTGPVRILSMHACQCKLLCFNRGGAHKWVGPSAFVSLIWFFSLRKGFSCLCLCLPSCKKKYGSTYITVCYGPGYLNDQNRSAFVLQVWSPGAGVCHGKQVSPCMGNVQTWHRSGWQPLVVYVEGCL